MKVGMVCPYSLTVPGGVQQQCLALARALRRLSVDVHVLAPCDGPPPDVGVISLGRSVPTASNGSVAPIAPDPQAQIRTLQAFRDEDFDVVHVHEPLTPGPNYTTMLVRPAPIVGTYHRAGESAAYRVLGPAVRWANRRIDLKVAVSEDALDLARRCLGGDYELLFNGIEIAPYATAEPWPTDGPTVLFVGRHEPRKGLEVLLGAVAHLPSDVRVWVGGVGPETDALRYAHGDGRIEWLGRIDEDEKVRRLAAADVFCAPSLHGESFGVVLLEAMAAGTVVVASDIPGYARVARPDRDGVLVEPGDPKALAAALATTLADPHARTMLVAAGKARVEQFSMALLAERYAELYGRLA